MNSYSSKNNSVSISFSIIKIMSWQSEIESINSWGNTRSISNPLSIFSENTIIIISSNFRFFIRFFISQNLNWECWFVFFFIRDIGISGGINKWFRCNSEPSFENNDGSLLFNSHLVSTVYSMSVFDSKFSLTFIFNSIGQYLWCYKQ